MTGQEGTARSATGSGWIRRKDQSSSLRNFPHFFILGPQRTGTTWLYHNLRAHPSVFLPDRKETYFFSTMGQSAHRHYEFPFLEDYLQVFREPLRRKIKKNFDCLRKCRRFYLPRVFGDATASHATIDPFIIEQIVSLRPEVKGIILLRHPIERIWSHARKELLRNACSKPVSDDDFLRFFARDGQRRNSDYRTIVHNWETRLQPGHLLLGDTNLIASDPGRFWNQICHFLGIAPVRIRRSPHFHKQINRAPAFRIPAHLRSHLEKELTDELEFFQKALRRAAKNPEK